MAKVTSVNQSESFVRKHIRKPEFEGTSFREQ